MPVELKLKIRKKCFLQRKNYLQIFEGCGNNSLFYTGKELKKTYYKEYCVFYPVL